MVLGKMNHSTLGQTKKSITNLVWRTKVDEVGSRGLKTQSLISYAKDFMFCLNTCRNHAVTKDFKYNRDMILFYALNTSQITLRRMC